MAKARPLRNPPITEAVIAISVRFPAPPDPATFDRLRDSVASSYPTVEQRRTVGFQVNIQTGASVQSASMAGYLFKSGDNLRVVQSKLDGFSFSRLKPYSDWDSTLDEAWRAWLKYRDICQPERVIRVSTRFINRLEFPGPNIDIDDYLTISPRLPEHLPENLSSYSASLAIPEVGPKTFAMIRHSFNPAASVGAMISILLDIDIVRECDLAPSDDGLLRRTIDELRSLKNAAFFGSLKEKAVEVFA